jgi:hypothetical protein
VGDPRIGRLVQDAFRTSVDVETASRHLWTLHRAAGVRRGHGARRTLVSALAAVLLFATTGAAVALSGEAVPGDALYVVKRGAERVHLLVSFAPESDARLHLRFARSRVAEAERVAAHRPGAIAALLTDIVAAVDRAQATGAGALSEEVDLVRLEASTALSALGATLDAELGAHVDDTIRSLDAGAVVTAGGGEPATERGMPPPTARQETEAADREEPAAPADGPEDDDPGADPETTEPAVLPSPEPLEDEASTRSRAPRASAPVPGTLPEEQSMATLDRLEGLVDDL